MCICIFNYVCQIDLNIRFYFVRAILKFRSKKNYRNRKDITWVRVQVYIKYLIFAYNSVCFFAYNSVCKKLTIYILFVFLCSVLSKIIRSIADFLY